MLCACVCLFELAESRKPESSLEASPANTSTNSGNPSEVSSLDEHHVEADQRHGQLLTDKGEVLESEDTIILEDVPIVTPNKDVVATGLSFQVSENVCMYAMSTSKH